MKTRGLLLAALLLLVAVPAPARPVTEVAIGVLVPPRGPGVPGGADDRAALALFADMVNGTEPMLPGARYRGLPGLPALGGARLRLVFADHGGRPEVGRAEAERLITREKVHALLGAWDDDVTAAASRVAERFAVPYLDPASGSPGLTRRGFKWFFRTSPTDEHVAQAEFDFLAELRQRRSVRLERVAVAHDESAGGIAAARVERTLARKYGYRVVGEVAYPPSGALPAAELARLQAAAPDVWLAGADAAVAVRLLASGARAARDSGGPLVLTRDAAEREPGVALAGAPDGLLACGAFAADRVEARAAARALDRAYRARVGRPLSDSPARAVTGLAVLVDAIARARTTEPEAVRAALARTDVPADDLVVPWTGVRFDENGQNTGVRVIVRQWRDGAYHTVWPAELATRELLAPVPIPVAPR